MARRSKRGDAEKLRRQLIGLLTDFEAQLLTDDVRARVLALVPAYHAMIDIGSSLMPDGIGTNAGKGRIISYLLRYPHTIISGNELRVVAGIDDWARRVRELRVEAGWSIISGQTAKEMVAEAEEEKETVDGLDSSAVAKMAVDDYILLNPNRDDAAAERWKRANTIRKKKVGAKAKILEYLRLYAGQPVTGEELRYVAKSDRTEWARRSRELRTQDGWPVVTRNSGRPDLPTGVYMLELDRQSPPHDRIIPDTVRRAVLVRDGYACKECGWNQAQWNRADPRFLELHHRIQHAKGGENTESNLVTLCTSCHDEVHRRQAD